METCPCAEVIARFLFFILGFGVKERFQIVTQHNRLRSRVSPMAANMQKMVGKLCFLYTEYKLYLTVRSIAWQLLHWLNLQNAVVGFQSYNWKLIPLLPIQKGFKELQLAGKCVFFLFSRSGFRSLEFGPLNWTDKLGKLVLAVYSTTDKVGLSALRMFWIVVSLFGGRCNCGQAFPLTFSNELCFVLIIAL